MGNQQMKTKKGGEQTEKVEEKQKQKQRVKVEQKQRVKVEQKQRVKVEQKQKVEKKEKSLEEIFAQFTHGKKAMNEDQLFVFIEEGLKLNLGDPAIGYILTVLMGLQKNGEDVEFDKFSAIFKHTKTNSIAKLRKKLPGIKKDAEHPDNFKKTYLNIFSYYTGAHKTLDLEVAEQLWAVYLQNKLEHMNQFLAYMKQLPDRETKKVHVDLWKMMLQFSLQIKDLKQYNEEDGWPVFIDGFVSFMKGQ